MGNTFNKALKIKIMSVVLSTFTLSTSIVQNATAATEYTDEQLNIVIDAGPLEDALKQASAYFKSQIVFISNTTAGQKVAAISGHFTKQEIFEKLLAGTHLQFTQIDANTIGISKRDRPAQPEQKPDVQTEPATPENKESSQKEAFSKTLEVVTVTAQRRVQNLQEVPLAISSFSGDMLEQQGISEFIDLARMTPGFTGSSFSEAEPIFAIRGATNTFSQAGTSKPVGVFLDDVYISRNTASAFQLYDLEQVAILRGPQGTLFGRNVTGGALVINTSRPSTDDALIKTEVGFGNYASSSFKGLISGPLNENWAAKLSGSYRNRNGYGKDRLSDTEQNDLDSLNLRAQLLYEAADDFSALLTLDYSDDQNGGRTLSTTLPENADDGDIRTSEHGIDQDYTRDVFGLSAHLDWHLANGDIRSITAYRESDTHELQSFSSTSYIMQPSITPSFPYQQLANNTDKPSTFSQELRFVSKQNHGFSYVTGLYYFADDLERQAGSIRLAGMTGNTIRDNIYAQQVDTNSLAIYADAEWLLNEQWTLNLGGRYTTEEKKVEVTFIDNLNATAGFQSPEFSERWNEFTPRISVSWQPQKGTLFYTSFTQGFTSGGFNTEGNNSDVIGQAFAPETIDAFELGLKSDFFDKLLRTNISVFRQNYQDKQEGYLDANFNFVIVNAAKAQVDGLEIELSWLVNDYLTVNGNYAYLDAQYDEFSILTNSGDIDDRNGNLLPSSPKNSFNLGINLFVPMNSGELTGNLGFTWQNDYYTGSENRDTFLIDSSSVLNGSLSYETDNRWRFTIWANNLTDEEYLLIRSDFGAVIGIGESYAMPRTYGLKIAKVFE